jgi:hypothetical protein
LFKPCLESDFVQTLPGVEHIDPGTDGLSLRPRKQLITSTFKQLLLVLAAGSFGGRAAMHSISDVALGTAARTSATNFPTVILPENLESLPLSYERFIYGLEARVGIGF